MRNTMKYLLPVPSAGTDIDDVPTHLGNFGDAVDLALGSRGGSYSSRPAAGIEGQMYFVTGSGTNAGLLYRDNGSTWDQVNYPGGPTGSVTTMGFSDSPAAGTPSNGYAPIDHRHGSQANPITAHVAATNPHTQYAMSSDVAATLDGCHSFGSTTTPQGFTSGTNGVVNTWTLTTKNMTYSGGTWTVTVGGFYVILASLAFAPAATPAGIRQVSIVVNNAMVAQDLIRGDAGYALTTSVSWGQLFAPGDTVAVVGSQSQGVALALSGYGSQNYVSIRRVGNA